MVERSDPASPRPPGAAPDEHESQLRLLLNATAHGIYGVDMDGNCTFANLACLTMLGLESDVALLGKNMHALIHHTKPSGEPYPVQECKIYQAFREEQGTHVEDEIVWRPDGDSFPAEYWSYPLHSDGELIGSVVTFIDITERRAAEAELRDSEERVRSLLDATGEGIYGVDMDGNCTFANPACCRMLGGESADDFLGKNMHQLVHHTKPNGEPYPVEDCRIYQAFREERGTHVEDEIVWRLSGESFPAEYWSYPIHRDGELVGSVVTFVDISERLATQEELRQSEKLAALGKLSAGLAHELNNPAAAAQRASEQVLESLERIDGFVVALSAHALSSEQWSRLHELRHELEHDATAPQDLSALDRADREEELSTWLDAHDVAESWQLAPSLVAAGVEVGSFDELARDLPPGSLGDAISWIGESLTAADLVGTIASSTTSISELVGAVKSYSYMDQAPEQEIDIHEGLESTVKILGHKLKAGTSLTRNYDQTLPRIAVPAGELNQVWTNLIDNAIDAAGPDGEIQLCTSRDGDHLLVEVIDDGGGIPADIQARIFDPFFTTKEVGKGTGLGLDVARRIVTERCHGEISVESEPGRTRLSVRLPFDAAARDGGGGGGDGDDGSDGGAASG